MTDNGHAPASRHLLANSLGRLWSFLSTFLFVPIYLHLLGIEGYGLIALYLAVSSIIAFLDLGFSPTLARELHEQTLNPTERYDLFHTYERIYVTFLFAAVFAVAILPGSWLGFLLSSTDFSDDEISFAIRLVFVASILQLAFFFYISGLLGIERQTEGNILMIVAGLFRSALVIIPLIYFPRPEIFFIWQIASILLFTLVARSRLRSAVSLKDKLSAATFERRFVTANLTFMGSMFILALAAGINTQVDKLFIGALMGVRALAEYSIASTCAQLLVFIVSPITITMLPRLVRCITSGEVITAENLFFSAYRLSAVVVCSAVGSMIYFAPILVRIWTGSETTAEASAAYLAPLSIGYALLALSAVPHCVAIAHKNLRGSLLISTGVMFTLPGFWFSIMAIGEIGAALTWLTLQAITVPAYTSWINRRLIGIQHFGRRLVFPALSIPLSVSLAINFGASHLISNQSPVAQELAIIFGAALITLTVSAILVFDRNDIERLFGSISTWRHADSSAGKPED